MNVHFEGLVGLPAAHFLDGEDAAACQVHGHGAACTERVAADIGGGVALGEEAGGVGSLSDSVVDVSGCDVLGLGVEGGEDGMDGCVEIGGVLEDVVDPAGEGGHDGEVIAGAVLGDGLSLFAIFLSWDFDGGFDCLGEGGEGGGEGDGSSVGVPEGDVFDGEGDGVGGASGAGTSVFAHPEEVEEGYVDEVGEGLVEVTVAGGGVGAGIGEEPVDDGDGQGELGFGGGILPLVALQLPSELFPAGLGVGLVGGVGAVVQLEGLADGAKRVLN